jgi:ABC-2 type transport system permease protein
VIRWRKALIVAEFELVSTVRRLGYLFVTFGMPLFVLVYGVLALLPGYFAMRQSTQPSTYGIVDESGLLGLVAGEKITIRESTFRVFESDEQAEAALRERRAIDTYYLIDRDYLNSGSVREHSEENAALVPWRSRGHLAELLRRRLLRDKVNEELAERVAQPLAEHAGFRITGSGKRVREGDEALIGRLGLPIGFVLLLFTSILMSGSYLIQATATEKENKVIEVLISSASADEVMTGKLLGLGGAGLLQVLVWISMALGVRWGFSELLEPLQVQVSWQAVALSPVLFVAAYLFIGSLMLGTGSLGGNVRESQQLGMLWAFVATLPLLFLPLLLADPHGPAARLLTWIPFSAPGTLVLRMSLDPSGITQWEILGSLLMLVMSTWLAVRVASRLFCMGMLLAGGRPRLVDILRQARP